MWGTQAEVSSTTDDMLTSIMERVSAASMEKLSPKRPRPAQFTRKRTSGDSIDTSLATSSLPSGVERSEGTILELVFSPEATSSSAPFRLATSQISSSPLASNALQNSAPTPEEAPVTIATLGIRRERQRLL